MLKDNKEELETLKNKFGLTEEEIEGYVDFFKKKILRVFNVEIKEKDKNIVEQK
jgi:hypothetical protein